VKDNPEYARLTQQMRTGTDEEFVADLTRFVDSFADHDDDWARGCLAKPPPARESRRSRSVAPAQAGS
jgi:hypothetical protein